MAIVSVGPLGNHAIGPFRIRIETDGENVRSGHPEVGLLHRGIEKIAERMTWAGFVPYTDRVDYVSSVHGNLAYALAVERLAGIEVPERASRIRVIATELGRIGSHLLALGAMADVLGHRTFFMFALRERERVNNLFEMLAGARLTHSYARIGGVAFDITEGFVEKTREFLEYIETKIPEYSDLLFGGDLFRERLSGLAPVSSPLAIQAGLTGPNLRASGLKRDVRKDDPYCGYERLDFGVPVGAGESGTQGDALDRVRVRLREISESSDIVRQALKGIPEGSFQSPIPRLFRAPEGEACASVESPRGTLSVYVRSSGGRGPRRVRFRAPSFSVLSLFPGILTGAQLSDVAAIVSSFDVCASEVDR